MSVRYALIFLLQGLALLAIATAQLGPWAWLAGWAGVSCLWVSAAYAGAGPRMFGKTQGRLHPLGWLALAPYHLFNQVLFRCCRWQMTTPALQYAEIVPNLFLGRRLVGAEARTPEVQAWRGVLDLTCEFDESRALREQVGYRCLPVLDGIPPSVAELQAAVAWLTEWISQGPVYVHCALGRGRSATVVAAYLLACGQASDAAGAIAVIQARRRVSLHARHVRRLEEFAAAIQTHRGD